MTRYNQSREENRREVNKREVKRRKEEKTQEEGRGLRRGKRRGGEQVEYQIKWANGSIETVLIHVYQCNTRVCDC